MTSKAQTEYRYEKLTWPEINDAVELNKVCIVPCGAVEQHGPHLPLDVDLVCPGGIAKGTGLQIPDKILVLPIIAYGYTGHVMDFPGTINTHYETFIKQVLDVTQSLAYHGFKKIILLNGHGSNMPNLDLVARRTNLETDAECVLIAWWQLLTVDKDFVPGWRESKFPGGCSHAGELETSLYLYLGNLFRPLNRCVAELPFDSGAQSGVPGFKCSSSLSRGGQFDFDSHSSLPVHFLFIADQGRFSIRDSVCRVFARTESGKTAGDGQQCPDRWSNWGHRRNKYLRCGNDCPAVHFA